MSGGLGVAAAAGLAAASVLVGGPAQRGSRRLAEVTSGLPRPRLAPGPRRSRPDVARTSVGLVAVLAGAVGGLVASGVLGGPAGLGVGAVLAVGVFRWLRGLESATARRRRELIGLDLPWAADLLAAAVEGGAGLDAALRAVADAVGGPLAAELRTVCAALALGASPASAWVGVDPAVGVVGRSFVRAADQGTPPVEHLDRLAADLRARAAAESSVAQRAAGVRALAPLGACFLPAFLLLAVLPMVAGVATTILR